MNGRKTAVNFSQRPTVETFEQIPDGQFFIFGHGPKLCKKIPEFANFYDEQITYNTIVVVDPANATNSWDLLHLEDDIPAKFVANVDVQVIPA
jgi:hypothetical protein